MIFHRRQFLSVFLLSVVTVFAATANAALPVSMNGQALPSLAPMIEKVRPAVVNIATRGSVDIENHPLPVNTEDLDEDSAQDFLSSLMKQRALQDIKGTAISPWQETLIDYLKNPTKILMLGLVLFIVAILAYTLLGMF